MSLDKQTERLLASPKVQAFLTSLTSPLEYSLVEDDPEVAPQRSYKGDAGLDLALRETRTIYPNDTAYIPSNVKFDVPEGLAIHVMTRSSTFRSRVKVIPTIVDHNYTGETSVVVSNDNSYPITVERGTRLAQAVIIPAFLFDNEDGAALGERNGGRFGSSGR